MRVSVALVLALGAPASAAAQGFQPRFNAPVGTRHQFVAETALSTILVGFPSLPDSTPIESTWRTVVTERLMEIRGDQRHMTVRLDSTRARAKVGQDPRSEVPMRGAEGLTARWVTSETLQPGSVTALSGDSAYLDALVATTGGFRFGLPEAPVEVGGSWSGPFVYPLGAQVSSSGRLQVRGSIGGRATGVLDSLVPRGGDTLVYLTVRAVASPTTLYIAAENGSGTVTFSGVFATAMVWSTGWNAIVSAGTNGRVSGTVAITRPEGGGPVNGAVMIQITGRQQVRP